MTRRCAIAAPARARTLCSLSFLPSPSAHGCARCTSSRYPSTLPSESRMKPTYIVGINAYHADVSAVLLKDGQLIAAVEEERFRRIKHWAGFPTESIAKVLEIAGITGEQIDHVAVSRDPKANLTKEAAFAIKNRMTLSNSINRT